MKVHLLEIESYRKENRLSQKQIGRMFGIDQSGYSRRIKGEVSFGLEEVLRFLTAAREDYRRFVESEILDNLMEGGDELHRLYKILANIQADLSDLNRKVDKLTQAPFFERADQKTIGGH